MTVEMREATFPTVECEVGKMAVNTLYGYAGDVEAAYFRDTLTPLPKDRKLNIFINEWNSRVLKVAFEVRSLDTSRLVEKTELDLVEENENKIKAVLPIKDLIDKNREYLLIIVLTLSGGEDIKYFTRIIEYDEINEKEYLNFVRDFSEKTFDKVRAKSLVTYLESNEQGDNSTFAKVDIHSNFNQVTWGNLNITRHDEPDIKIVEMDSQFAAIVLKYRMWVKNGEQESAYNIKEYFRVRYTKDRMYLLDYERSMNQIFTPEESSFANDKILLGILGDDAGFTESPDGASVSFVQENILYSYKNSEGKLSKVFSFDTDDDDIRTRNDDHRIVIQSADENGNLYFSVYGYMNRGNHEGMVGVCEYYYESKKNMIEELMFIPYTRFSGLLKSDLDTLSYINRKNKLFLYLYNSIYCFDLYNKSLERVIDGIDKDRLVTSRSNQLIAYKKDGKTTLRDLANGRIRNIIIEQNENIDVLGFIDEDVVYGVSKPEDVITDFAGNEVRLMNSVYVESERGEKLKKYAYDGIYVTAGEMDKNSIRLRRIKRNPETGEFDAIEDDVIINNHAVEEGKNKITRVVTDEMESVTEIALLNNVPKTIHMQRPKEVLTEGVFNMTLSKEDNESENYFVYGKGDLAGVYSEPSKAINHALTLNGAVVSHDEGYIWQKCARSPKIQITDIEAQSADSEKTPMAVCVEAMLNHEGIKRDAMTYLNAGKSVKDILQENIDAKVLDLEGVGLSAMLYYLNRKYPVFAITGRNTALLIVGYDEKNIVVMDPETGTVYKKGMNDSTQYFMENGNRFITYVK